MPVTITRPFVSSIIWHAVSKVLPILSASKAVALFSISIVRMALWIKGDCEVGFSGMGNCT
jgi:hypothetical protein